jgi:two-component system invasion response regulator UvrY
MIRVLIADDHAIVRKGLKQLLVEEYSSALIEEAGDAEELIKKVITKQWDVVICDMNMPGRSGLDALKQIKQATPKLPVLIMSMYPAEQYAIRVLKAGASGYLSKDSIHDELIKAIETALSGKKFITSSVAEKMLEVFDTDNDRPPHELLSDREFDVLKLLASGKTITEIADQLSISATTISTYRSRILEKMNMRTNAELIKYSLENKLF